MNQKDRDRLMTEMHTDIKWIKQWIAEQNKYKIMVWSALVASILALIFQAR